MKSLVFLLTTCTCLVRCLPPPHPDVLAVRQEEERLHPLQRSPALRNPHLLQVLPLTSLLHKGENLVRTELHLILKLNPVKVLTSNEVQLNQFRIGSNLKKNHTYRYL